MSKDLKSPWQSVYYAFQERSEATERETRDLFFSLSGRVSKHDFIFAFTSVYKIFIPDLMPISQ